MDIHLIYDPHELETETHESKGIRKKIARRIERLLVKSADHTIVVSDSIKKWYKEHYNLVEIEVIKNIPSMAQNNISPKNLKLTFGINPNQILFIYQGYLSISRGVKDILNVFENIDESKHIVFMGYGPLEEEIKLTSITRKNIHYLPASKPQEVLSFTSGADVGIHIIPNTCLNHFYCLPNKVFEYAVAGVPFIASNFPDIKNEFEEKNVAWFVEPGRKSLFELVKTINTSSLQEKKANCVSFKSHWRWEKQDPVYIHIFDSLRERRKTQAKEL